MSARNGRAGGIESRWARAGLAFLAALVLVLAGASAALAAARWRLSVRAAPTQLTQKGEGFVLVQATDAGDAEIGARTTPVTITDTLPEGVTATAIGPRRENIGEREGGAWSCSPAGSRAVSCTYNSSKAEEPLIQTSLQPYESLELDVNVAVHNPATSTDNMATVEGGREAKIEGGKAVEGSLVPEGKSSRAFQFSEAPTPFGVEPEGYKLVPEDESGVTEAQGGVHPFQLTTTLNFNQRVEVVEGIPLPVPAAPALVKNLHFNLPPGLLGNVTEISQCTELEFATLTHGGNINECPPESALGVARLTFTEPETLKFHTVTVPVFNLVPAQGEPARFGLLAFHVPVYLDTHVRSGDNAENPGGGDYGVEVSVREVSELAQVLGSEVTLWGVPGDVSHDQSRGWVCVAGGTWVNRSLEPCMGPASRSTSPFLTMPTACATALQTAVTGESWPIKALGENGPGRALPLEGESTKFSFPTALVGCEGLPFSPSLKLSPTTQEASTPTGLNVDVHVPQATTLEANGHAEADVRTTTIALPPGVELSPSAADGLGECTETEIGYQGEGSADDPFSPSKDTPEPRRFSTEKAQCPPASKVGTVKVKTPLLKNELEGSVYLATPAPLHEDGRNPFKSLVALYIVAEDPRSVVEKGEATGIRVKIAGEVKLNPETGQITSTFENTPQVPFEDFEVSFDSGPRASVSTPASCGPYTTTAAFTPWSVASETGQIASPYPSSDEFQVTSGPGGGACSNPRPFAPSFSAGTDELQAGAFDPPFSLTIGRPDADQALKSVSVTLPPGLAARIASLTPCPEPRASLGTCGPDSLIGHATAVSGLGPDPFTVTGGRVYFTGPYNGAPFGLSIVTPAVAGPFDLGEVVVRSSISVNPSTAAVTINSVLPSRVQGVGREPSGVPLQLKAINVVVDRPGFQFNPTNCTPMSIAGTLGGVEGATAGVSAPFQVKNCSNLPFHPTFTASTEGRASKAEGASLKVRVTSTPGQANIGKTDLTLPIALPSRLTTIQKACAVAVFEVNPATCPEGSNIGTATVHTPVLRNPLAGPAYLVSHGAAKFPDVEFVLQGERITLVLDGATDIKKGITYSRFETLPDAPVETFETVLPRGPHSALTSNVPVSAKYSLCGTNLVMPTTITGQNGAVIHQNTKISVTGCARQASRAQLLAKALQTCRKKYKSKKTRRKRVACEASARKKYGPKKANKAASKNHRR